MLTRPAITDATLEAAGPVASTSMPSAFASFGMLAPSFGCYHRCSQHAAEAHNKTRVNEPQMLEFFMVAGHTVTKWLSLKQ